MDFIAQLSVFAHAIWQILTNPAMVALLLGSSFLGIIFGALPGLTATLGVALLTTLTYSMDLQTALISLIAMYVGAVYGGSYPAILINIPGTAAGAATGARASAPGTPPDQSSTPRRPTPDGPPPAPGQSPSGQAQSGSLWSDPTRSNDRT